MVVLDSGIWDSAFQFRGSIPQAALFRIQPPHHRYLWSDRCRSRRFVVCSEGVLILPTEVLSTNASRRIIDQVSVSAYGRVRHYQAPFLAERALYLEYLLHRGNDSNYLRTTAGYLLQIVHTMNLDQIRVVSLNEIEKAAVTWSKQRDLNSQQRPTAAKSFAGVARRWFSFLGTLELPPQGWFEWMIQTFVSALSIRGLKRSTIVRHGAHLRTLFRYLPDGFDFREICVSDVDSYFNAQRAAGWKPKSIVSACNSLRAFFRFAELQGWCRPGIHLGIQNPRVRIRAREPMAPTWREVLRLLNSFKGEDANERQGKAMVMLCAIYGFRTIEVVGLQLDDIDWRNETLAIRKAKGYGVQHYPLHYEVGQAILSYLQNGRPICSVRSVFVTRRAPFREFSANALWQYVGPRLREIGTRKDFVGPHSLRHACATRLLQKGASLKQIADFLGHRNLRSVDIYARCDPRSLRKVAMHSLKDLL